MIFSSRTIPGNERGSRPDREQLVDLGCEIITDGDALVHVTGHPRRDELKEMYALDPAADRHPHARRAAAPGGARRLARAAGVRGGAVVRNGAMVRLAPGPAEIIDRGAPVGRLFRDGNLLVSADEGPVRERRSLAYAGIVIVALARSARATSRRRPRSCSTACRRPTPRAGP